LDQPRGEVHSQEDENFSGNTIPFTIMSRKGNKQQVWGGTVVYIVDLHGYGEDGGGCLVANIESSPFLLHSCIIKEVRILKGVNSSDRI